MKTQQQVDHARNVVVITAHKPDLTDMQKQVLTGMSVALQWVADAGGTTLQRLIDGEQLVHHTTQEEATNDLLRRLCKEGLKP